METWQQILRLVNCQNKTFSLDDKDRNEFRIMKFFTKESTIREQILLWLRKLEHNEASFKKNIHTSEDLRKKGNKAFQNKKYLLSLKYYTVSLQYAPWDSEGLPLALANRSAALFHLHEYDSCIKDIELAIKYNYPKNLTYKLYLRAAQCYSKLGKKVLMEEALNKVNECLEVNSICLSSKKESIENQVSELLSQTIIVKNLEDTCTSESDLPELKFDANSNFANASTALDLKFSIDKGRHVLANRDIKKGEILFVEKPFAFVLLDNKDSDAVCANCCKIKGEIPIPCKFCANTIYCSEKCENEAWSTYHQWECFGNQIGLWDQIGIAHLTIRTFLKCCYTDDEKKFNEIQQLVTNIDKISSQDMFLYGVSALMMTLYLKAFTNFFKTVNIHEKIFLKFDKKDKVMDELLNIPSQKWTDDILTLYASGTLLRHMLQLICNGHAITRLNLNLSETKNIVTEYQCRVATAIYPSASMMNHSCNPNIINSFKDQYLIVKATKDIPCNGEVLNCYGPHYRRMKKKDRQKALKSQYCFVCKCDACTQRELQNFSDKFRKFNCEDCEGPVEIVNDIYIYCLDCESVRNLNKNKLRELEEANQLHEEAEKLVQKEKFDEALTKAKRCLEIRKRNLFKYHEAISSIYDFIGKILAITGQWQDSISYLEYSIVAVEERYGSDSIELANELNKITDVCFQYLREEIMKNSKQYKNILKKTRRFLQRAEEIFNLNYGPWNEGCAEVIQKQQDLLPLLVNCNL